MMKQALRIGVVAGEPSGDALGTQLITEIRHLIPHACFMGIAGSKMQAVGCETWFDMAELSVMGLAEVLRHLPRLWQIRRSLIQRFTQWQPQLFIGIDAPDFNIGLALALKQQGIRTVQYVCPSVWAWRPQRIHKIVRAIDLVLALLPFEQAFCERFQVACHFIGHPAADEMPLEPDQAAARHSLQLPQQGPCLALLPGSRASEINRLATPFLQAAALLHQKLPTLTIVVPLVAESQRQCLLAIRDKATPRLPLTLLEGQARSALTAATAALVASGTVTLEAMLAHCPMVVAYRLNPVSFWLAKRLVTVPYIALPNLLANQHLVPEFLQDQVTPQQLATALEAQLTSDPQRLQQQFQKQHRQLQRQASQQAAKAVLQLVDRQ
ncbi:MAG: lipid-A-disaccharide synthase [Candidatus Symbiodolus clandestinus]